MSTPEIRPGDAPTLDVVGVGIGPFNLGLAALLDPVADLSVRFFDASPAFSWHPGLLLEDAEIQVPFLADLVTLADPTSPHSFLNYLHEHGRLYRFYFHERFHLLREEFQAYCRWVASRLASCRFGVRVLGVSPVVDGSGEWLVATETSDGVRATVRARHVVFGTGTVPTLPGCVTAQLNGESREGESGPRASADGTLLHSAAYVEHRERLLASPTVTVVGSGQSAAEVFLDLLENGVAAGSTGLDEGSHRSGQTAGLAWITRSTGFLAMEYSKLGLEHFSPEYTDHFHALAPDRRDALRDGQDLLYKGISSETSAQIYDRLYQRSVDGREPSVAYRARTTLRDLERVGSRWRLALHHRDEDRSVTRDSDAVVLATGYAEAPLPLVEGAVARDEHGRPLVDRDYRLRTRDGRPSTLFVQNAELHTHGVGTPDLGLAAHRNATIVNALCGRSVYAVRERNVFQSFGLGAEAADPQSAAPGTEDRTADAPPMEPRR